MVYNKDEIMLEAEFDADVASIMCTSDMLIHNFCEFVESAPTEELYAESAGRVFDSLKATVHKLFTRVSEFTKAQVDKLDAIVNKEKYKKMMSPEMQKMFAKVESGKKVKCPDFVKAKQIIVKMENFTEKFKSKVAEMIPRAAENPGKWSDKFSAFADKSKEEFGKIKAELDSVLNDAKEIHPRDVIKMVKNGIDIKDIGRKFQDKLEQFGNELSSALDKVDSIVSSATAKAKGIDVKGELGKLKGIISKASTTAVDFAKVHAQGIATVSKIIGSVFTAIGSVGAIGTAMSGKPTKALIVGTIGTVGAGAANYAANKQAKTNKKLKDRKDAMSSAQAALDSESEPE